MADAADLLTEDGFLDGRLRIWQPRQGYRAATDPVFLAAAVAARPAQSVLELGCGAGVASLCLAVRVAELDLIGVERQSEYADLARRNAAQNGIALEVVEADLAELPATLRQRAFDHVIANPPYYRAAAGTAARDSGRDAALRERTPLDLWVAVAARRLRPGGYMTMIQSVERLAEVLGACTGRLGSVTVLPLAARAGRPASRVIIRARKGGRAGLRLLAPLVVHEGARHDSDGESMTAEARRILRAAQALPELAELAPMRR